MTQSEHSPTEPTLLTVRATVIILVAVLIGAGAGGLTYLSSRDPAAAVLAGGAAFGASLIALNKVIR